MFYSTTVKEITADGVKDIRGKNLTFAGNLPCKEGDTVWTDGKIILGHAPIRGGGLQFRPPSGVPVLAGSLSGYFKSNGTFKEKSVTDDDWITNDSKYFNHGAEFLGNAKVIDAEIGTGGELYVVTDGLYRQCQAVSFNNHLFTMLHNQEDLLTVDSVAYSVYFDTTPYVGEKVTLGCDAVNIDTPVTIFKNGTVNSRLDLKSFAETTQTKCLEIRNEIMRRSANSDTPDLPPAEGYNYFKQPAPPKSFIASSYARIVAFKINPTGDWDAIISASSYGYCFPYLMLDGSVLEATFNSTVGASKSFSEDLIKCISEIERSVFTENSFPFLEIEQYPKFTGEKKTDGKYTAEYQQYIENAIEYYIPLLRFKHFEWYVVAFGASMLFHVHNGVVNAIRTHTFGGNEVYQSRSWDETKTESGLVDTFCVKGSLSQTSWDLPLDIDNEIYLNGTGFTLAGITGLSLPNFYQGWIFSVQSLDFEYHLDPNAEIISAAEGYSKNIVFHRNILLPIPIYENYRYGRKMQPVRNYIDKFFGLDRLAPYNFADEIFDEKALTDDSRDGLYRFSPSFAKLQENIFLFGNFGGELFLYDKNWRQVGDSLKNFRLREMKNVNKAKN